MSLVPSFDTSRRLIALVGNPNSGKTSVFNALTGLRQKVANYPGVTVEKKEGRLQFGDGTEVTLLDLPGTYSLTANSPDEAIATGILLGRMADVPAPEAVVCVVDASNIERNLYLLTQIIDCRMPVVVALNMMDVAEQSGVVIDVRELSRRLDVPVVPTIAQRNSGIDELRSVLQRKIKSSAKNRQWILPRVVKEECDELSGLLQQYHREPEPAAFHEALHLLSNPGSAESGGKPYAAEIVSHLRKDHEKLEFLGFDCQSLFVEARYEWIRQICAGVVRRKTSDRVALSDRVDRILTHRIWGFVAFISVMMMMFQTIFSWSNYPMNRITSGVHWLGEQIIFLMPPGDLRDLIVHGALAGAGAVLAFLPQILFLFFFIGILEDTGYMARAAFMMDRVMGKVGLHGKSFIPLLSSFACAIPGIMATRTIESKKDRLVTILVAPLISCSARLPVYTLLIASFIPARSFLGVVSLPAVTLVGLYLLGLGAALTMALIFKKTLLRGEIPAFIMELPRYKMPSLRSVTIQMWERSVLFVRNAGTVILGASIILWFLASYPKVQGASPSEQLERSFAGSAGHILEPVLKPLGFDWKIGIGLVGSLLQREVFVSTMATIYNIRDGADGNGVVSLGEHLRNDIDPSTGKPSFTLLTAICLMVYYVLAMQCLSTVAVVKRETNGWKWPIIQIAYMTVLAYCGTLVVYNLGKLIE